MEVYKLMAPKRSRRSSTRRTPTHTTGRGTYVKSPNVRKDDFPVGTPVMVDISEKKDGTLLVPGKIESYDGQLIAEILLDNGERVRSIIGFNRVRHLELPLPDDVDDEPEWDGATLPRVEEVKRPDTIVDLQGSLPGCAAATLDALREVFVKPLPAGPDEITMVALPSENNMATLSDISMEADYEAEAEELRLEVGGEIVMIAPYKGEED